MAGIEECKFCSGEELLIDVLKQTVVFRSVTVNVSQSFEGTMKAGKSHKFMVSMMNV